MEQPSYCRWKEMMMKAKKPHESLAFERGREIGRPATVPPPHTTAGPLVPKLLFPHTHVSKEQARDNRKENKKRRGEKKGRGKW